MKFALAWADVTSQNHALRFTLFALSFTTAISLIFSLVIIFKPPIVVERGCVSEAFQVASNQRTKGEIENFIRIALVERFSTSATVEDGHLSPGEFELRQREQKELQSRGLDQKIIVGHIDVTESVATVDCDRLISINNIRSAFPLKLKVKVESKNRGIGNPYGLVLVEVKPQQENK
jgi:hypothetical protein